MAGLEAPRTATAYRGLKLDLRGKATGRASVADVVGGTMSGNNASTVATMGQKRFQRRDEAIIDPEIPIIDAHHHLFDFPHYRYLLDDYLKDAKAGHNIVASVYVEIHAFARRSGPEYMRPLGEVEFANGVGAMCAEGQYGPRVAAAIVGHADLRHGDAIGEFLDRAISLAPERFRGIRQVTIEHESELIYQYITNRPPKGVLQDAGFRRGFAQLTKRRLIFDAAVFHNQIPEIRKLADDFPEATIVLNHLGIAMGLGAGPERRKQIFDEWHNAIRDIANYDNVYCKIGGLGLPFWGLGYLERTDEIEAEELAADWRPFVEGAVETFGPERCMMESNYPPDSRSCGFVPLWNALKLCVQRYSDDEKRSMFSKTAARVYRIERPGF